MQPNRNAPPPRGRRERPARGALAVLAVLALGCATFGGPEPEERIPIYTASAAAGPLRAGAAAVDITPTGEVFLAGFRPWRTSRGVHDPLFARALVLERGDLRVAIVALDVIGLQRGDVLRLHDRIRAAGFEPRHVIVHATHTHSGPDTLGLWGLPPLISGQQGEVMERVASGVQEALSRAAAKLRPAEIASGGVRLDPAGILKNLRRPGLVDPELVVVHVRERAGGSTVATLVELGCHPEVLGSENRLVTSDFPAWLRTALEERFGGVGLYVSGAIGGLVTPDVEGGFPEGDGGTWAGAEDLGRRLGAIAGSAVDGFQRYEAEPPLAVRHAPLYIRNANFRYHLVRWTRVLRRRMFSGGYVLSEVNLWRVGPLRVATVPGEITPDLGIRIKREVGGDPTLLVGLANDELGYLLPSADFDLPIYDYERTVSPGADAGDRVRRRLQELRFLEELVPSGGRER